MGNLLSAPITTKETDVGVTGDGLQFGISSMQGWRIHMEDAHIAEPEPYVMQDSEKVVLPGHSLFAVFDGHGGKYAALYSGANFVRVLSTQSKLSAYWQFTNERAEKESTMEESRRSAYVQDGLEMLESALLDTFVDLDKEIAMALHGRIREDATDPFATENAADSSASAQPNNNNDAATDSENATATAAATTDERQNPSMEDEGEAGTTACIVMVTPEYVICANAGDSRSVFSRMGNRVVPLSFDHKPDDKEEERRIRAAGGYVAGGRVEGDLAVSRGLGDFRFKRLEVVMAAFDDPLASIKPWDQKVSPIPDITVQNRDPVNDKFVLIACDGIWDVRSNAEAVKMVSQLFEEGESDLGLICEEVLDSCLALGSKDNMTALVIRFGGQALGEGGGVTARRQLRMANSPADDGNIN